MNDRRNCKYKTFLLGLSFTIGLFLLLISPCFLTEGMFMDGLIYSTFSRNLFNKVGSATFWTPYFSETFLTNFHGHPPLAFGLQSICYYFGDSFYVDKIYSVLTFVIAGVVMIMIWKILTNNINLSWVPLAFWVTIPLVFWGATNNMLENTMQVFTILCLYFCIKGYKNKQYYFLLIAGLMLFLAFLTKGFTGLYLLSFPFFHWVFFRDSNIKTMFANTVIMLIGLIGPLIILFICNETAFSYILEYCNVQVVRSVNHVQTVDSRFYIVWRFIEEIMIPVITIGIILLAAKNGRVKLRDNVYLKWIYLLSAITLSGILPIMISLKQSGFYILTVFPICSIVLGLIVLPTVEKMQIKSRTKNLFAYFSIFFLCIGIASNIYFCGQIGRDKTLLKDIHTILPYLQDGEVVSISDDLYHNYALHGYLARTKNISLDAKTTKQNNFIIAGSRIDDSTYKIVTDSTQEIFLYSVRH